MSESKPLDNVAEVYVDSGGRYLTCNSRLQNLAQGLAIQPLILVNLTLDIFNVLGDYCIPGKLKSLRSMNPNYSPIKRVAYSLSDGVTATKIYFSSAFRKS